MSKPAKKTESLPFLAVDDLSLCNMLPFALLVLAGDNRVKYANPVAEQLFNSSELVGEVLASRLHAESPLLALLDKARNRQGSLVEHELSLTGERIGRVPVHVRIARMAEEDDRLLLCLVERSIAHQLSEQQSQQESTRSAGVMAAMLAHEIKNPLLGIRGAAQLLFPKLADAQQKLTTLIQQEVDRISGLLDQVEFFASNRPLDKQPVNIHQVLADVQKLAQRSFNGNLIFAEHYDPSLPPVWGNHEMLVQLFFNLVKNAAEALADIPDGQITLTTRYRIGHRFRNTSGGEPLSLPIEVTVEDNGPGIAEAVRPHLFEPFSTTKFDGKGLGLAIVSKIANDHGGYVACDNEKSHTAFRVFLPKVGK
ncbi:MAG: two-component sensor histidine kinase [Alphaproteobacteria bacterium]|nr:two-component sensor histidine kinase [Alphaproteobacteria bacterium]